MKELNTLLLAALATLATLSIQTAQAQEVLSKATISIYGNEISLPTVRNADGTICQSYVAETTREGDGLIVKIGKVCGAAVKVSNGLGGFEYYPAGLHAMQAVIDNGQVTHQLPVRN